jgi:coenzyme F420 hydrogenase subunit delta
MLDWYARQMIVGVGNPLYTDDGFGPAVVSELKKLSLPDDLKVLDVGLAGPHFLFTLIAEAEQPVEKMVIVDILDFGGSPGQVAKVSPDVLADEKTGRYMDPHSWGGFKDPLTELSKRTEVIIIGCQPESIAISNIDNESEDVDYWLTEHVTMAIPKAVQMALAEVGVEYGTTIKSDGKNLPEKQAGRT